MVEGGRGPDGSPQEGGGAGGELRLRLVRGARERLELARSFGWEIPLHWPPALAVAAGGIPRGTPKRAEVPVITKVITAVMPGRAAPEAPSARRSGRSTMGDAELNVERERRRSLLAPLAEEVRACVACELCRHRRQTVFGTGDPCARLMFIGEGPGEDEDRQGEPFVGPAGQLLTRMIQAMGLGREDVYIANIVKCRPPQNRTPEPREIISCTPFLHRQIEIVSPDLICTLGNTATRAVLQTPESIGRLRGRFAQYREVPVLPTFHPSYLLRNPDDKKLAWEDLQKVMGRLGLARPAGA